MPIHSVHTSHVESALGTAEVMLVTCVETITKAIDTPDGEGEGGKARLQMALDNAEKWSHVVMALQATLERRGKW